MNNKDEWLTEEELLAEDFRELDEKHPGWDRKARIIQVAGALKRGVSKEILLSIYGEEIVSLADEQSNSEDGESND